VAKADNGKKFVALMTQLVGAARPRSSLLVESNFVVEFIEFVVVVRIRRIRRSLSITSSSRSLALQPAPAP
jgi:hypothetical protein